MYYGYITSLVFEKPFSKKLYQSIPSFSYGPCKALYSKEKDTSKNRRKILKKHVGQNRILSQHLDVQF